MPSHKQVTNCLQGGAVSKYCTCNHCNLAVCSVCGAYEGGLTTDCPGESIPAARQKEVYETLLDYSDERGWHLGNSMEKRSPRFAEAPRPVTSSADPRDSIAPEIDWRRVDQHAELQHRLALKALAWALADRDCEELSAALTHMEDEADKLKKREPPATTLLEMGAALEREKIGFQKSCRKVERCEDEFKQAARQLLEALEEKHKPLLAPDDVPVGPPF